MDAKTALQNVLDQHRKERELQTAKLEEAIKRNNDVSEEESED